MFPHLLRSFNPVRKQAGDNSGGLYHRAIIDGNETYRIVGNRGSAKWFSISVSAPQQNSPLPNQYGYKPVGEPLLGHQLKTQWDGSFIVTLSPDRHEGNWIKTTPEVRSVLIREFFADWASEQPMLARLERVGHEAEAPPLMSPQRLLGALGEVGEFIVTATQFWPFGPPQIKELGGSINKVHFHVRASTQRDRSHDINAGGISGTCHWVLDEEQALILEFSRFEAAYWSFDLLTFWYTSMDYRYRHSSLNSRQARMDRDGKYRIVICARDPGIANWLDTSGWHEGFCEIRANLAPAAPPIDVKVVPRAAVGEHLPSDTWRVTTAERAQIMAARAAGVTRRFRDY